LVIGIPLTVIAWLVNRQYFPYRPAAYEPGRAWPVGTPVDGSSALR
jgi:hypothetical protein